MGMANMETEQAAHTEAPQIQGLQDLVLTRSAKYRNRNRRSAPRCLAYNNGKKGTEMKRLELKTSFGKQIRGAP